MIRISAFLLVLFSSPVMAEWVSIFSNTNGDQVFIDPTSFRGVESRRLWTKTEFATPREFGLSSVVALEEFDCVNERKRIHESKAFSLKDLKGEVLRSSASVTPWVNLQPGTSEKKVFDAICRY